MLLYQELAKSSLLKRRDRGDAEDRSSLTPPLWTILRHIRVHVSILALHVILLNQAIDVFLDIRHAQDATRDGRLDDFRNEFGVGDGLAALHDADNGRLSLEIAVFGHAHVGLLVLFLCLLELDLIDLHTIFGVVEGEVDGEGVGVVDVLALGMLRQRTQFGAGKGLKGAFDFGFGCGIVSKVARFRVYFRIKRGKYSRRPLSARISEYGFC